MTDDLGPIEVICDAPPYPVVRACAGLGFETPQDVRWIRTDRKRARRAATSLIPFLRSSRPNCSCGEPLPELESYTFTFVSGTRAEYYLAQCTRCRTIFWDKD
jgi:hypothetical protein